jgi:hypothetical protein
VTATLLCPRHLLEGPIAGGVGAGRPAPAAGAFVLLGLLLLAWPPRSGPFGPPAVQAEGSLPAVLPAGPPSSGASSAGGGRDESRPNGDDDGDGDD